MRLDVRIEATPELPRTKQVVRIISSHVARAARGARTEMVRAIREELPRLRSSRIRQDIQVVRGQGPTSYVNVRERPLPLREVVRGIRAPKARGQQPGGLRVRVGPGMTLDIPKAFVVKNLRGDIFMRRGHARLPLRKLMAPSVRDMAISTWDDVKPRVEDRLQVEIRRALHRAGFTRR